jgi:hypothetical protein
MATSNTSVTQGTETASEARKRKAVSILPNTNQAPAIRTNPPIHVPEGYSLCSPYTREQLDADPDLPYYLSNVSRNGNIEENKRIVAAIKFQPPGSTMTPAMARQFPLLERSVRVGIEFLRDYPGPIGRYLYG